MSAYVLSNGQRVYPAFVLNSESGGGIVTPPASFRLADGTQVTGIVLVDENGDISPAPVSAADIDGMVVRPDSITGRFYSTRSTYGGSRTTLALPANFLTGGPLVVPTDTAINQIALGVTVAAAAGKLLRLMLFDEGTGGRPGALLEDSGNIAADTAAPFTAAYTVSRTLQAGRIYHLYVVTDGTPTVEATGGAAIAAYGTDSATDANSRIGVNASHTFGAGPTTFPALNTYLATVPHIVVRAA